MARGVVLQPLENKLKLKVTYDKLIIPTKITKAKREEGALHLVEKLPSPHLDIKTMREWVFETGRW